MTLNNTKTSTISVDDSGYSSNQPFVAIHGRSGKSPRNQNRMFPQHSSETNSEVPLKEYKYSSNQQEMIPSACETIGQSLNRKSLKSSSAGHIGTTILNESVLSNDQQQSGKSTRNQNRMSDQHPSETNSETLLKGYRYSSNQQEFIPSACETLDPSLNRKSLQSSSGHIGTTILNGSVHSNNQQQSGKNLTNQNRMSDQHPSKTNSETPLKGYRYSSNQQEFISSACETIDSSQNRKSVKSSSDGNIGTTTRNGSVSANNQQSGKSTRNQNRMFPQRSSETNSETLLKGYRYSSNQQEFIPSACETLDPSLNRKSLQSSGGHIGTTILNGSVLSNNQQQSGKNLNNQNRMSNQHPSETNSETPLKGYRYSSNQQEFISSACETIDPSQNQKSVKSSSDGNIGTTTRNGSVFANNQQSGKSTRNQNRMFHQHPSETNSETPLKEYRYSRNRQKFIPSACETIDPSLNQKSLKSSSVGHIGTIGLNGSVFSNDQQQSGKNPRNQNRMFPQHLSETNSETPLKGYRYSSNEQKFIPSACATTDLSATTDVSQKSLKSSSDGHIGPTTLNGSIFSNNQHKVFRRINNREKQKRNLTLSEAVFLKLFSGLSNGITESKLFGFLLFYEKCNTFINPSVSAPVILFKLSYVCFCAQLKNSALISKVLLIIHQLSGKIMSPVVFFLAFNCICNYILPRRPTDVEKRARYVSFLAFFLEHCNAEKLIIDGKRIPEIMETTSPLLYGRFFVFSDTNCVLCLLQHGLSFNASHDGLKIHPIFLYILELLSHFAPGVVYPNMYGPRSAPKKFISLLANFTLLLKTTYNPRSVIFNMAAIAEKEFNWLVDPIYSFLKFASQGEDIKLLSPPTLKHLSRYAIRKRLYENWNLPYGIRQLPVERRLISYLQLCAN